jgi:hypothetical protein
MPGTPLLMPTTVTSSVADNVITVTWDDTNPAATVANFAVTFLAKDTLAIYTPPTTTTVGDVKTLAITIPPGSTPSAATLADGYIARVIAKAPSNSTTIADSAAGLQIYWESDLSLVVTVGSHEFTLTKASTASGIYRLPVSRDAPITITLDDIKSFADTVGIGASKVPTKWPNGDPITGSLNLYKLAVDTDRKLFALDIAFTLNFSPIPGLTINEVGLSVLRTNGVNGL